MIDDYLIIIWDRPPVIQSKQAAISLQGNLPKSEVEPNEQNYLELSTHSVEVKNIT